VAPKGEDELATWGLKKKRGARHGKIGELGSAEKAPMVKQIERHSVIIKRNTKTVIDSLEKENGRGKGGRLEKAVARGGRGNAYNLGCKGESKLEATTNRGGKKKKTSNKSIAGWVEGVRVVGGGGSKTKQGKLRGVLKPLFLLMTKGTGAVSNSDWEVPGNSNTLKSDSNGGGGGTKQVGGGDRSFVQRNRGGGYRPGTVGFSGGGVLNSG